MKKKSKSTSIKKLIRGSKDLLLEIGIEELPSPYFDCVIGEKLNICSMIEGMNRNHRHCSAVSNGKECREIAVQGTDPALCLAHMRWQARAGAYAANDQLGKGWFPGSTGKPGYNAGLAKS